MKVYIAGPMTGIPDFNYPAFHALAERLRGHGFEVVNPAESFGGDQSLAWQTYLRDAIKRLVDCDAIAVLPGWEASKGAMLEATIARALEMHVIPVEEMEEPTHALTNDCLGGGCTDCESDAEHAGEWRR